MTIDREIADFVAERNAMLLSGDVDRALVFHAKWNPGGLPVPSREIAEAGMHKARTAARQLPIEVRRQSKAWLAARGMASMDDGDLDAPTRLA